MVDVGQSGVRSMVSLPRLVRLPLWSDLRPSLSAGGVHSGRRMQQWSLRCDADRVQQSLRVRPAMVAQPVTETVMQQVPVTEYRQVRQTVRKPIIQTSYVDQPVTEYRQVVEQKTVSVPTCSYQNITECHTVQRNCGQWVTKWHCNPKISPCEYDNRPGLMGEMNRIGFATRQAFTPSQYATREYVQQTVAQQVPVTRKVAIQGTKQVTYNVARMVPTQTTRKVAVNTMKYVDEEVVVMQPVTVVKSIPTTRTSYRLVPAGSALALGPATTDTALRPTPEPELPKTKSATRDSDKTPSTKPADERRGAIDESDDVKPSRATNDSAPRARYGLWRPKRRGPHALPAGDQLGRRPSRR